jgi:hypothetical protein
MATPRTVGRMPFQRMAPALPYWRRLCSSFDLADGGAAVDVDLAHFTRTQANLRVDAFASHQRDRGTRRARDLRALARQHFHAVDRRTHGDVADGQRVAGLDGGFRARHQRGARFDTARGDDVAALAVGVAQQRDVGGAVGVVLDALDLRRDAVLVARKSTTR